MRVDKQEPQDGSLQGLVLPLITNGELKKLRELSRECYSELISHVLVFKGGGTEDYRVSLPLVHMACHTS